MQIKFLFINAIDPSKEVEAHYPPLGIGYLITSLRKRFGVGAIEFRVVDSNIEEEIINFGPDIVGISAVSQNYGKAITYAKTAKKYGISVICGGVHISMMPTSFTKDMDVGVIGEGENTICDLVELFERKMRLLEYDLRKIRGIIYWDSSGKMVATEKRDLISPLDKLSPPARDLFDIGLNTYMFTSRGCPYRCTFCASSRFWKKVRFFSAEYVVDEVELLVNEYNVKHINFQDDLFSFDVNRIRDVINLLRMKDLLGKVSFSGAIRANLVNDEIIGLLKEMGIQSLGMGLESGCKETLRYLKGANIDIKDNEDAIRIIRKQGITTYGSFIIGSPEEDKKDILETLKFVKRSQLDGFGVYVLTPFPGTPVWDYGKAKGLVDEQMDWHKLNVNFSDNYTSAIILSQRLTRNEIYKLFLRFKKYQMRKSFYTLIKKGLQNPLKIPGFFAKNLNKYWERAWPA